MIFAFYLLINFFASSKGGKMKGDKMNLMKDDKMYLI